MADGRIGQTARNLVLALVNATLLLAALCLWLAWQVLGSAERVSGQLTDAAQTVLPLRTEIVALTEEVASLRILLAERQTGGPRPAVAADPAQMARIEDALSRLTDAVTSLGADPDALIDRAVAQAFAEINAMVMRLVSLREVGGG
ncbi:hypothetical protein [Cognatishimia sp. F0-27]|uniref:hypothetical protein n=1 Tax=Cognatishimia sp. F0-27 TaxID=2816855 RepID=UPI001D0C4B9C|nr:hypothetical protein [Cognatishimia sp. F0-27]MCC1493673.1 hypothetical protein [Cognatishimia sp. F0-27]